MPARDHRYKSAGAIASIGHGASALSEIAKKATRGFEPLLPEKADGETQSPEPSSTDVPELNPFLARILERVTRNERERAK